MLSHVLSFAYTLPYHRLCICLSFSICLISDSALSCPEVAPELYCRLRLCFALCLCCPEPSLSFLTHHDACLFMFCLTVCLCDAAANIHLFFNRKELPTTARLLFLFFCCNFYHCLDFILLWGAIRVQLAKSIIEFCISANHVHFLHSSVCFPTRLAVRPFFYITSTFQCCKIQWWHHCPPSFQHFTSERAAKQDHTVKGQYIRLLLFYTQLWTMSSDDILCGVQEAEEIWA